MSTTSGNKTVRVAMIGAGSMANNVHYPSWASFRDVQIAGICDLDAQRLNSTADKYGVQGLCDSPTNTSHFSRQASSYLRC